MKANRSNRGAAMLTTVVLLAVLLGFISAVMYYASAVRRSGISSLRKGERRGCAEAGLMMARTMFFAQKANWEEPPTTNPRFLSAALASTYNNIASPIDGRTNGPTDTGFQSGHTDLFADLDGDGKPDVYFYIHDNPDEQAPALEDATRDNDLNAVIGAICISQTMAPRLPSGAIDTTKLAVEGLLQDNSPRVYKDQLGGGDGSGNVN